MTGAHVEPGGCPAHRGDVPAQRRRPCQPARHSGRGRAGRRVRRRRKSNARWRRRAACGPWRRLESWRSAQKHSLIPPTRDRAVRERATGNRTRGSAGRSARLRRASGAGHMSLTRSHLSPDARRQTPACRLTTTATATPPPSRQWHCAVRYHRAARAQQSRRRQAPAVLLSPAVSQPLALLHHPWLATLVLGLSCRSMLHNMAKARLSRGCFNVFPAALHRGPSPGTSWSRAWIPKALSLISICLVAGPAERVSTQAPLTSAALYEERHARPEFPACTIPPSRTP